MQTMKPLLILILSLLLSITACHQSAPEAAKSNVEKQPQRDSTYIVYKVGSFIITADKEMEFDIINKEHPAKTRVSKGDTLYNDNDTLILGDFEKMRLDGLYKKYNSRFNFSMFKVDHIYKGKLAQPDFSDCPKDFKNDTTFQTTIESGCDSGINFAGHYTIVEWFCGTECSFMDIIDRINGKLYYELPMDTVDGYYGAKYSINSRMILINSSLLEDSAAFPGYCIYRYWQKPAVYVWNDSIFKRIE